MIVKICGITNADDARLALEAGADWIGLNLVAGPRRITIEIATEIAASIDAPASAVALVLLDDNRLDATTAGELTAAGIRRLQLYGDVSPESVRTLADRGFESIAVFHVAGSASIDKINDFLENCGAAPPAYVLLDAAVPGQLGGTGRQADWNAIATARAEGRLDRWPPIILAGGLTPENVAEAISRIAPHGIDASSGVESAPGRKDQAKLQSLIAAAKGQ